MIDRIFVLDDGALILSVLRVEIKRPALRVRGLLLIDVAEIVAVEYLINCGDVLPRIAVVATKTIFIGILRLVGMPLQRQIRVGLQIFSRGHTAECRCGHRHDGLRPLPLNGPREFVHDHQRAAGRAENDLECLIHDLLLLWNLFTEEVRQQI